MSATLLIHEISSFLESKAPLSLQESYDNSGLLIGNHGNEISKALICLDCTEEVLDEAITTNSQMIIAHHPLIFSGIKKLTEKNEVERCIIKAIKNDIAIYAIHTNLDNILHGVNAKIAEKLGLMDSKILQPKSNLLLKLAVFVPKNHVDMVANALYESGAGHIGNYDSCSFRSEGKGTFRALEGATPFVGNSNEKHSETEIKLEVILKKHQSAAIISAMNAAHPYDEVAFDLIPLTNSSNDIGAGQIGSLANEMTPDEFIAHLKSSLNLDTIKSTPFTSQSIRKIAICGGSGAFLTQSAKAQKADVYISADFKYHDFFEADNQLCLMDIGHFESERFTIDLIHDWLSEKFPTFALLKTEVNTNPVNYL